MKKIGTRYKRAPAGDMKLIRLLGPIQARLFRYLISLFPRIEFYNLTFYNISIRTLWLIITKIVMDRLKTCILITDFPSTFND